MIDLSTLLVFVGSSLALLLVPGPVTLYIIARGINQGRGAALVSVAGMQAGDVVHIVAAAVGLSAILVSSATLFTAVKLAGAAYLVYLGIRTLLTPHETHVEAAVPGMTLRRVFVQGAIVNILNPKTAIFFFAFLPQFVDPSRGAAVPQILFFGAIFMLLALCVDGCYALAAGAASGWLKGNTVFLRAQRFVSGGIYIALGAATALTGSDRGE